MKRMFLTILILTMFIPIYVNAETCNSSSIKLKSIELNKTEGNAKELSPASINGNKIKLDIKLYDPGDYLEYYLTLKNTSNEDYYFDENSLKFNIDYLEYKFSYDDNSYIVKAGKEKKVALKVEYKNRVQSEKLNNDMYKDNNSINIVLANKDLNKLFNPDTGNRIVLFVLFILTIMLLMTIKTKRSRKCLILIISLSLMLPVAVYAVCKSNVTIETKVEIDGKEANFLTGQEVNIKMKELAGDDTPTDAHNTPNNNITKVIQSNTEPIDTNKEIKNIVSTPESRYPIYVWYEDGIIYWWSEDLTPNVNEDASNMFDYLNELVDIKGLKNFDTSNVKNMRSVFFKAYKLQSLEPLSKWNTSKVTNMRAMFVDNVSLTSLDGLENWDVSNVETMQGMFILNGSTYSTGKRSSLRDISALKNWNTSKVTNMYGLFQYSLITNVDALENWDVSKVEDMQFMFNKCFSLTNIDGLSNWDVSNVVNMAGMFNSVVSLTNVNALKNWDVSNVEDMQFMFGTTDSVYNSGERSHLTDISALSNWDTSNVTNMDNLFRYSAISNLGDLRNWNTSNVETMGSMFRNCTNLTTLDGLQNWDVSKVTNFSEGNDTNNLHSEGTFEGLTNLTDASAINNWNIRRDAYFNNMFKNTPGHPEFSKVTGNWGNGTFIPN